MVFAFGHLIGAWLIGKLIEIVGKRKISQNSWFFLLAGSILPDLDYLFNLFFKINFHRTMSHSFFFAVIISLIVYYGFNLICKRKAMNYAYFLFTGILIHLTLDAFSPQGIPLLWPFPLFFATHPYLETSSNIADAVMDMFLGTTWIFYLWLKNKIQF
ncbi:hypothetical protein COY27_03930 [Candidatus Woesearchaeota archaeon CG_4_10_14_0_2_um_filter_33_13]|nr:MAG: hypothetical protein COY27_03930 [Candidatus Woesearchaeota archaeon CG_4_10_14_0_2_um_filter_33_13]